MKTAKSDGTRFEIKVALMQLRLRQTIKVVALRGLAIKVVVHIKDVVD
jgi:hypothetical protein